MGPFSIKDSGSDKENVEQDIGNSTSFRIERLLGTDLASEGSVPRFESITQEVARLRADLRLLNKRLQFCLAFCNMMQLDHGFYLPVKGRGKPCHHQVE